MDIFTICVVQLVQIFSFLVLLRVYDSVPNCVSFHYSLLSFKRIKIFALKFVSTTNDRMDALGVLSGYRLIKSQFA